MKLKIIYIKINFQ